MSDRIQNIADHEVFRARQCSRRRGYGPLGQYCKQHALGAKGKKR